MSCSTTGSLGGKYDAVVIGLGSVGSFALRALSRDKKASSGRFLGIERYGLSSTSRLAGSFMGRSRIFRRAYFEHEQYVPWIEHSIRVLEEVQFESQVSLLERCGTLIMESPSPSLPSSPPCYTPTQQQPCHSHPPYIAASLHSASVHDIPVEYYNASDLPVRFPQFRFNPSHRTVGVYEPSGGFIRPELTVDVALQQAQRPTNGSVVDILDNSIVTQINNATSTASTTSNRTTPNSSTYSSRSSDTLGPIEIHIQRHSNNNNDSSDHIVIQTDRLLLSAGSWTGQLIPEWKTHLNVVRQVQAWIDVGTAANSTHDLTHNDTQANINDSLAGMFSCRHMPTFVLSTPDYPNHAFYGVPCDDHYSHNNTTNYSHSDTLDDSKSRSWLKCGLHKQSGTDHALNLDPSRNGQEATTSEIMELQRAFSLGIHPIAWNAKTPTNMSGRSANKAFQKSVPEFVMTQPCLYTMSPDKHYIIGQPKGYRNNRVFAVAGLSGHGFKCAPALGQMMADFVTSGSIVATADTWKTEFCSPSRFHI